MKQEQIDHAMDEWTKISLEMQKIKSQGEQIRVFFEKTTAFIKGIWQSGYDQGYEEGKESLGE